MSRNFKFSSTIGGTTVTIRYTSNPVMSGYIVEENGGCRALDWLTQVRPMSLEAALKEAFEILDRLRRENRM